MKINHQTRLGCAIYHSEHGEPSIQGITSILEDCAPPELSANAGNSLSCGREESKGVEVEVVDGCVVRVSVSCHRPTINFVGPFY